VGAPADLVFADPLHNFSGVRPDRRSKRLEGPGLAAQPSSDELIEFLTTTSAQIATNVRAGATIFFCVNWRHLDELAAASRRCFGKPRDLVVWCKTDAARGSFYQSQHEHIAVYVAGPTPSAKVPLHGRGRHRSNVWTGYHMPGRDSMQKPVALLVDVIRDCSRHGDTVLDPFAGFGTTMFAAERTGRRARLIEIDPACCDLIVRRWQAQSGKAVQLAESNEAFAEVERRRRADGDRR
jgi:DNA methylase